MNKDERKPEANQMWKHDCGWVNMGHRGLCTGCMVRFAFLDSLDAVMQLLHDAEKANKGEKK